MERFPQGLSVSIRHLYIIIILCQSFCCSLVVFTGRLPVKQRFVAKVVLNLKLLQPLN